MENAYDECGDSIPLCCRLPIPGSVLEHRSLFREDEYIVISFTHGLPSNLTAHIISLPLTLPRLPCHLKHTVVRTAIRNGTVFELNYVGAIGGENDPSIADPNVVEIGPNSKRNWWASARELVRVTKGKGILVSGGVFAEADHRAPRDIVNLYDFLFLH